MSKYRHTERKGLFAVLTLATFFLIGIGRGADAVKIVSVKTTFHAGTERELSECFNGTDINRGGWSVYPHTDQEQSAVFALGEPVAGAPFDLTLSFLSGRPLSYPREFMISTTSDRDPSLAGVWEAATPRRFSATGPELGLNSAGHIVVTGEEADAVFEFSLVPGSKPVTGLRLDLFPSTAASHPGLARISDRVDGDIVLTQLRVEAHSESTTNIALGCPVVASEPVRFPAGNLTDGLPGTFTHPLRANNRANFYFQIDLGKDRKLDHISLRNRGDGNSPDRMSCVILRLFHEPPDGDAKPTWRGESRADGSRPEVGAVDLIRAEQGVGSFSGRWLRLSSESRIAYSPQFAEVEVYEDLIPKLRSLRADGHLLSGAGRLKVPAGSHWLNISLVLSAAGLPKDLDCRWRLEGNDNDWRVAKGLVIEGPCPAPGRYLFEAQIRHTDGEWNSAFLKVPVEVQAYLWETAGFRWLLGIGTIVLLIWGAWEGVRRRMAAKVARLEATMSLNEERARIARDMHDDVGAKLSQLAILQDIFVRDHGLQGEPRQTMQRLSELTRKVITALDEVVWAVNPRNDTLASLAGYIEQCATDYLGSVGITCRIDAPYEWPLAEVRAQVRHNLVQAVREALQNILKHSEATEVLLQLRLEGMQLVILLADNGRGLPAESGGLGKDGLSNMEARLALIGGRCSIKNREGGGTEVEMSVAVSDSQV